MSSPQVLNHSLSSITSKSSRISGNLKKEYVIDLDPKEPHKYSNFDENPFTIAFPLKDNSNLNQNMTSKKSQTEFICSNNINECESQQEDISTNERERFYSCDDAVIDQDQGKFNIVIKLEQL